MWCYVQWCNTSTMQCHLTIKLSKLVQFYPLKPVGLHLLNITRMRLVVMSLRPGSWFIYLDIILILMVKIASYPTWLVGLGVWFSLRVREVPGSNPGQAQNFNSFGQILQINNIIILTYLCHGLCTSLCYAHAWPNTNQTF